MGVIELLRVQVEGRGIGGHCQLYQGACSLHPLFYRTMERMQDQEVMWERGDIPALSGGQLLTTSF